MRLCADTQKNKDRHECLSLKFSIRFKGNFLRKINYLIEG